MYKYPHIKYIIIIKENSSVRLTSKIKWSKTHIDSHQKKVFKYFIFSLEHLFSRYTFEKAYQTIDEHKTWTITEKIDL